MVLAALVIVGEALLTPEQRVVYDKVCKAVDGSLSQPPVNCIFFFAGIGWSGKTFANTLLLDRCWALAWRFEDLRVNKRHVCAHLPESHHAPWCVCR